jgi:ribonuclease P/MRP protein subunit POP3
VPPLPEISSHVVVGLEAVTRTLEREARYTAAIEPGHQVATLEGESGRPAAVFVSRSVQPTVLSAHFPLLVAAASASRAHLAPIRLVQLSKGCEERMSMCMGIPRAGFLAVLDTAPFSATLIDATRTNVAPVDVSWVKDVNMAVYKPLKMNAIQTRVGVSKKKARKSEAKN